MIKVITWFRRRPGMALDDFRSYWRNEHPKVVLQMPGLRKYCQNHVQSSAYRDDRQPFCDGAAETWWDSLEALRDLNRTDELAAVMADEENFIDAANRGQIVAAEVVIVNGAIPPGAPPKQLSFLHFRDGISVADAQAHWRGPHGTIASKVPGMRRYVQNHVLPDMYREDRPAPACDGIPVVWFEDLAAMRVAGGSQELADTRADEPNFLDDDPLPWVICDEHHIV